jgi:hypothetical protein
MSYGKTLWRLFGGVSIALTLTGLLDAPFLAGIGFLQSTNPWSLSINMVYLLGEVLRFR